MMNSKTLVGYLSKEIELDTKALDYMDQAIIDAEDLPEDEYGLISVKVSWEVLWRVNSLARKGWRQDSLLRDNYDIARVAVFRMVEVLLGDDTLLERFYRCTTEEEYKEWLHKFTDQVEERAQQYTWRSNRKDNRAPCPLCGATPQQSHGWTIPEGLYRHLGGYGNTYECPVIKVLLLGVEGVHLIY